MSLKMSQTTHFQRQVKQTSDHCCVPFCKASSTCNGVLRFFGFPTENTLRRQWLANIRRGDYFISSHSKVCSRHFTSDQLAEGRRRLIKGAVPFRFQWHDYSHTVETPLKVGLFIERGASLEEVDHKDVHNDHNYCAMDISTSAEFDVKPSNVDTRALLNPEREHCGLAAEDLRAESQKKKWEIEDMAVNNTFGVGRFAASDDDIKYYTRFSSYAHLMAFWRHIEPVINKMAHMKRTLTNSVPPTGIATPMQPIDEFFLFMTFLSLGQMQKDLTSRFQIQHSAESSIIKTWANILYCVLGAVSIWMSEEAVRATLPDVFQEYSDTQVVLDYTEMHCQPSESEVSLEPLCNFKGLIGLAPHGAVTFVSALYKGSIQDLEVLRKSGITSLLQPTMAVMVTRRDPVKDCLPCKVYSPDLLLGDTGTPSVTNLRVHVDKLLQRVKEHKIFNTVIPYSLTGSIEKLYTVTCLLVNYQNGLQV